MPRMRSNKEHKGVIMMGFDAAYWYAPVLRLLDEAEVGMIQEHWDEFENLLMKYRQEEIDALKAQVNALRDALQNIVDEANIWTKAEVAVATKALSSTPEQCLDEVIKEAREKALDDAETIVGKEAERQDQNAMDAAKEMLFVEAPKLQYAANCLFYVCKTIRELKGK